MVDKDKENNRHLSDLENDKLHVPILKNYLREHQQNVSGNTSALLLRKVKSPIKGTTSAVAVPERISQRSPLSGRIRRDVGKKYIETTVVVDPTAYAFHGDDTERVIKTIMHIAAERFLDRSQRTPLYMTLNELVTLEEHQNYAKRQKKTPQMLQYLHINETGSPHIYLTLTPTTFHILSIYTGPPLFLIVRIEEVNMATRVHPTRFTCPSESAFSSKFQFIFDGQGQFSINPGISGSCSNCSDEQNAASTMRPTKNKTMTDRWAVSIATEDEQNAASTMRPTKNKTMTDRWAYGSWCNEVAQGFFGGSTKLTVFAFNDTAFNAMPAADRQKLQSMTFEQKREYVETFTILRVLSVNEMQDGITQTSMNGRKLFINKRDVSFWQPGGTSGRTATFVNGAMIVREQIQASNGVIHVLDRPLGLISNKNAYNYMQNPDDSSVQIERIHRLILNLYRDYYSTTIAPLAVSAKITLFLPSDRALSRIPNVKLMSLETQLQGKQLSDIFRQHFIPNTVVFTSVIKHQDNYPTGMNDGKRLVFLRNNDDVYVKSGGVTALIEKGNITVSNGVIHIIDRLLGYVYNTAREQLTLDAPTFNRYIDMVDPSIRDAVTQNRGVNLFVPSDTAFQFVSSLPWINLDANRTLLNYIIQLHMIKDGSIDVAQINGNYDVRQRRTSRYNDWPIVIYNDRNDTWVNAGHVRSRIIRPDVQVTTGQLQFIDGVLGVPTMDIPTLVYYDDWLLYTYNDLKMLGLDVYMKDPRYDPSILPPRSFNGNGDASSNFGVGNNFQFTQDPYGNNQYPTQYPPTNNNQYPTNNNQYPTNNNQYPTNNQYPSNQYPSNQYPNNQYPNNQYPNNQYPNNQYPSNQYPTNNQVSSYGTCGTYAQPCQFTFFCPNGSAIYNYYLKNMGNRIIQDHPRYRYIMRRLMVPGPPKYIENLPEGRQSYAYITHSGETITLQRESLTNVRLFWGGMSAKVIMWDLGATNGVVHIIDTVLSDISDINRDISGASGLMSHDSVVLLLLVTSLAMWFTRR